MQNRLDQIRKIGLPWNDAKMSNNTIKIELKDNTYLSYQKQVFISLIRISITLIKLIFLNGTIVKLKFFTIYK